jgi:hypothetical protein
LFYTLRLRRSAACLPFYLLKHLRAGTRSLRIHARSSYHRCLKTRRLYGPPAELETAPVSHIVTISGRATTWFAPTLLSATLDQILLRTGTSAFEQWNVNKPRIVSVHPTPSLNLPDPSCLSHVRMLLMPESVGLSNPMTDPLAFYHPSIHPITEEVRHG